MWRIFEGLLVKSWLPGSAWRVALLRLFGARMGRGVVIKPGVRVKFPWKLAVGDHSWIGEAVWIDNLAPVTVGNHCCLSQGAYLCTGGHRWDEDSFALLTKPIVVEDHCWIAAQACIGPGVTCGEGAVLTLGSVATSDLDRWSVYSGSPANFSKPRTRPNAADDARKAG